jgi:hypothetical protein
LCYYELVEQGGLSLLARKTDSGQLISLHL